MDILRERSNEETDFFFLVPSLYSYWIVNSEFLKTDMLVPFIISGSCVFLLSFHQYRTTAFSDKFSSIKEVLQATETCKNICKMYKEVILLY